ncbi:hypothetical protein OSTOST_10698 [Ostertagia ostertagi]
MTVILEIYEGIRKEITSKDFLLGIKMNSVEFQERGLGVWKTPRLWVHGGMWVRFLCEVCLVER